MPLHAQRKGKAGEVEFCKWLLENLGIDVERNYNQADGSSADVITDDFIFEVKRREKLDIDNWWYQVMIAKKNHKDQNLIPVVPFRKNRQSWRFAVPCNLIPNMDRGYVVMSERVFIEFAQTIIPEPEMIGCHGGCGRVGDINVEGGGYYCGGSERCIP